MKDDISAKGHVTLETIDKEGSVFCTTSTPNLIMNAGLEKLAKMFVEFTKMSKIGVGTNSQPPTLGDTYTFDTYYNEALVINVSLSNATFMCIIHGFDSDTDLTDAGLITRAGDLFSRAIFPAHNVPAGMSVKVIWTVSFND